MQSNSIPSQLARLVRCEGLGIRAAPLMPYLVGLWGLLAVISYRGAIANLFMQWQTHPSYSHGPLVVPIAAWLLWCRRSSRPEVNAPWPLGCVMLVLAHLLLWLGDYFYLPAVQLWSIPLWLAGAVSVLWGRATLIWCLPSLGFLAFMIPAPFQLEMLANRLLQSASAWCSCQMLAMSGTVAVTDGYTLRMSTGNVGITADCSGLRMTVAIAALGYVITMLGQERFRSDSDGRVSPTGIALHLCGMILLVIPVAIVANAARIASMAFVVDRFQQERVIGWAHDLGDWLVLPVAAGLFLLAAAWLRRAYAISRRSLLLDRDPEAQRTFSRLLNPKRALWVHVAMVPAAVGLIAAMSVVNYQIRRSQLSERLLTAGMQAEAAADWARAMACYQELIYLDTDLCDARYRHAMVSRRAASSEQELRKVITQFESILARSPFHIEALKSHLDLALELNEPEALATAQRLYSLKRHDAAALQMCIEAMLRFHSDSATLPTISIDNINHLAEKFGPAETWRSGLVLELADLACRNAKAIDATLRANLAVEIKAVAHRVNTTEAHYRLWCFDQRFGDGSVTLAAALDRLDDQTSPEVAYEVCVAGAATALQSEDDNEAKRLLVRALRVRPNDHRGYELLGDVFHSNGEWDAAEKAYRRAWRLDESRSLKLGIKLSEALLRTERYALSAKLVENIESQLVAADATPAPNLRVRMQLVRARLELHEGRYQESLQCIEYVLATWDGLELNVSDAMRSDVETLQAQCFVKLGRYAEAARLFERRATRTNDSSDQWWAAARAWRSAGNASDAKRCYRNAVLQSSDQSEHWLEYVHLLVQNRDDEEARREILAMSKRQPEGTPGNNALLAQAWEMVGDSERLFHHYRLAAIRNHANIAALAISLARQNYPKTAIRLVTSEDWSASAVMRAHTAAMVGIVAQALEPQEREAILRLVRSGLEVGKDDVKLLVAAAEWFEKCGDDATALDLLQRVVDLEPSNSIAANNLAMLLAEHGEFERAVQQIDAVLQRGGPVPEFLDTKGWILVLMDQADAALPLLTEAARRSGGEDPVAQLHLASAYLAVGDRARAKHQLEQINASNLSMKILNDSERTALATLRAAFESSTADGGKA